MFKLTKQQQQQLNTLIIKLLQWSWNHFRTIIIATPQQWGLRIERFARLCAIIVAFMVAAASFTYQMGYKCGQMLHQFNDWWTQTTAHQAFRSPQWRLALQSRYQIGLDIVINRIDDFKSGLNILLHWLDQHQSNIDRLSSRINLVLHRINAAIKSYIKSLKPSLQS